MPRRADAWTLLGIVQQRLGQPHAAEAAYDRALRADPDYADAWTNLGNLRRGRDDLAGTLRAFQHAMRCAPASPEPAYNLGVALEHFGLRDGALAAFEAAIECDSTHADAHWNRALGLLRTGRFAEGFREYEWRFRRGDIASRGVAQPVWDGRPLDGRTILVWAEQGFGDALQFLRFVPEVARCGGRVVLEVMDGLQGLASRVEGVAEVIVRGSATPTFDTHVALMSLPHVLGVEAGVEGTGGPCLHAHKTPLHSGEPLSQAGRSTLNAGTVVDIRSVRAGVIADTPDLGTREPSLRAGTPYLRAGDAHLAPWRARLAARGHAPGRELAIGLVWAGNPALRNSHERSPGFDVVRPLLDIPRMRIFSLQKGAGRADLAGASLPPNFVDLDAEIAHFDDTAAAIAHLDLVVTCDTAVAHLAGGLGKPVFVMLPHTPDWRYGLDPYASPWYPTMRLFRQATRGDWSDVLARLSQALSQAVASLPSQTLAAAHA
jgi:hypothetical protein